MNVTLRDIAERAGVSLKTVSRVINKEPQVSSDTRARIERIIEEIGYQPNYIARSLKKNKTNTIGYIVPDISNQFFGVVGKVIERLLRKYGYSLVISSTHNTPEFEVETLKLFASQKVDGIIFATLGETKEFIRQFLARFDIPIVAIDNKVQGLDLDVVLHDNFNGACLLTDHLIQHHHDRIVFVGGPLNQTSGILRFQGYQKALRDANIPFDEKLVKIGDWQIKSGYELVSDLIESGTQFSALISANSYMALGCLRALRKHGYKVPRDIAMVSFDNFDFTEVTDPPLTTLRSMESKIGITAAKLLLSKIENPIRGTYPVEISIPAKLYIRESCGCCEQHLKIP